VGRLFGTDGVRGRVGADITDELAFRLGRAAGLAFRPGTVLLARDTRPSGRALSAACAEGLAAAGSGVHLTGVLPSPAVSHLVARGDYHLGVVISASHNPPEDNGVKFYGPTGAKLAPEQEARIEGMLERPPDLVGRAGTVIEWPQAASAYRTILTQAVEGLNLAGVHVALDCAFGATAPIAPELFRSLGATLSLLSAEPDGERINATGATRTQPLADLVRSTGADLGIAYDGDGDRALFVDAAGERVEGDRLMAALAPRLEAWGELRRRAVVFTVLGNLGAERFLSQRGFDVLRVDVGDRNVAQAMETHAVDLGGEPSGHIVFRRHTATGDGILTSLMVLAALRRCGCELRELVQDVTVYPQVRIDVPVADQHALYGRPEIRAAIKRAQAELDGGGRMVVRPSGTQHLLRIMGEGPDAAKVRVVAQRLADTVHEADWGLR